MIDKNLIKRFVLVFHLTLAAVYVQSQVLRPVVRAAYPAELSAGIEILPAPWTQSEARLGIGYRPEELENPVAASFVVAQRFLLPVIPIDIGAYLGMEICVPDSDAVFLPRFGMELGFRFPVTNLSFRASIGLGFGTARYSERYDGPAFSSERAAMAYEPGLSLAFSWRGKSK